MAWGRNDDLDCVFGWVRPRDEREVPNRGKPFD